MTDPTIGTGLDWLPASLAADGDRPALVCGDRTTSYGELRDLVARWADRLAAAGAKPGDVVGFRGDYSADACGLLLAAFACRATAVPLAAGPDRAVEPCWDLARVGFVVDGVGTAAPTVRRRDATPDRHPLMERLRASGSAGLVLFTSGSSGATKAVLLDPGKCFAWPDRRPALRTLAFLLLDHIGGLNTLLRTLHSGGTVVTPAGRDPDSVCAAVAAHRVQVLPTTPTFLRMLVISEAVRRHDLSSLETVTYGTEPMPEATLRAVCEALPGVRLKQTYGLSEVGILPTRSAENGSLWLKLGGGGYETQVRDGVLWVRTPAALLGYLNADAPVDADGWFNTQDAVEVNGEWVRIVGRKSELINVGGEKVYPAEVESHLLEMDNVADATVFGVRSPVTGQVVGARLTLVRPEDPAAVESRAWSFLRPRLAAYKIPVVVEVADGPLHGERFKKVRAAGAGDEH